jgi:hypothetical protein
MQIGKTIFFKFRYTLAGAGVGTGPTFTLPAEASATQGIIGTALYNDTGTNSYVGTIVDLSTTIATFKYGSTTQGSLTSSSPHTWAATDVLSASGFYEVA